MAGLSTFDMCWAFTSNLEGVKTLFFNLGLVEDEVRKEEKEVQVTAENPTQVEAAEPIRKPLKVKGSHTLPAYVSRRVDELQLGTRNRLSFRKSYFRKDKSNKKETTSKTLPRNLGAEAKKGFCIPKSILKKPATIGDHAEPLPGTSIAEKGDEECNEVTEGGSLPNKIVFLRIDDLHIVRPGETKDMASNERLQ